MRRILVFTIILLLVGILLASCSGMEPVGQRTPVPTMPYATPAPPAGPGMLADRTSKDYCLVYAVDAIQAWVKAQMPEKEPFEYTDALGRSCTATFADISILFTQPNVWFPGALACTTCHGPDLPVSFAMMNLSDYQGILAGSRRASPDAKGNDILGGGQWDKSRLFQVFQTKWMPLGRPATLGEKGPLVLIGKPK
jgi:hypothetical protein